MNKEYLKLQLEQVNFIVGDLDANYEMIVNSYNKALNNNVDLVVFSELAITGYPAEDLLLKDYFIQEVQDKIEQICNITKNNVTAILFALLYLLLINITTLLFVIQQF